MTVSSNYIPLMWKHRLRTIPSSADRMTVAVYLISRYKELSLKGQPPVDKPLSTLAFWSTKARKTLFYVHTHLVLSDPLYATMVKEGQMRRRTATRMAQRKTAIPATQSTGA